MAEQNGHRRVEREQNDVQRVIDFILHAQNGDMRFAYVSIKQIFTSSLVWNVRPARLIHARALTPSLPCTLMPKNMV